MIVFTPAERRAVVLLVGLLLLGAAIDEWGIRPWARLDADLAASDSLERSTPPNAPSVASAPAVLAAPHARVDINSADARELDTLPGVGPVLAGRILEHRRQFGAFRSPEDLRAVRGIGPHLYARLEPLIRLGPSPAARDTSRGVPNASQRAQRRALFTEARTTSRR